MSDELRRLEEDRQVVLIGNLMPIKLFKTPYWKRKDLIDRFHRNPYFDDEAPGPTQLDDLKAVWGTVYYALVCLMAPHPLPACLFLGGLGWGVLWLLGG
jgi:hypothetical protein